MNKLILIKILNLCLFSILFLSFNSIGADGCPPMQRWCKNHNTCVKRCIKQRCMRTTKIVRGTARCINICTKYEGTTCEDGKCVDKTTNTSIVPLTTDPCTGNELSTD